jgi:hypothetical protein
VIQEEGFYAYDMHNIVGKQFSIRIAPVRNRGESLVEIINKSFISCKRCFRFYMFCFANDFLYVQVYAELIIQTDINSVIDKR